MLDFSFSEPHLSVKDKFILLLGEIYKNNKTSFEKALRIKGIYKSKSDVPREAAQILGAPYWVETNISTPQKAIVLFKVLDELEYDERSIVEALRYLLK